MLYLQLLRWTDYAGHMVLENLIVYLVVYCSQPVDTAQKQTGEHGLGH